MIIDCVMASYETDVLRVRDAVLADVVDARMIVVGKTDFRGRPNTMFDAYEYTNYRTDTAVQRVDLPEGSAWDKEFYLRDAAFNAARDFFPHEDNWFIVADADEIPHPSAVLGALYEGRPATLLTDYRQWFMNWRAPDGWQLERQPTIGRAVHYQRGGGPANVRIHPGLFIPMKQRGWHLSTCGDAELASRKLSTFSHAEFDTPEHNHWYTLQIRREQQRDLLDRFDLEVTDDLPPCWSDFPDLMGHPDAS